LYLKLQRAKIHPFLARRHAVCIEKAGRDFGLYIQKAATGVFRSAQSRHPPEVKHLFDD
jgi:hypothetical protein